ncbi:beta-lactamase/transpeptidase-like protein [Lophium mytilinum]|uniref:Beta-lactamase/transpeptidase-like protein n=1 Tax=Lophium mytilinum TaxID=390894 RepID=A0A6A6R0A6_9PEZI|nr:beta-lactamase/transpeptidase-like protein [Lophium mytilinum]
MAPSSLSDPAISQIKALLTTFLASSTTSSPGIGIQVTTAAGTQLLSFSAIPESAPSTQFQTSHKTFSPTSIAPIHSFTKLVITIACLQLVERGLFSLDDEALIPTHLPELAEKKLFVGFADNEPGTPNFEDRKSSLTLRHLLTHIYGGAHSFFDAKLLAYQQEIGKGNWPTNFWHSMRDSPLCYQPGERFAYGAGMDWVAVLIERVTGQSMSANLASNVFEPLGMADTSYIREVPEALKHRVCVASFGAFAQIFKDWDKPMEKDVEEEKAGKARQHRYPGSVGLFSSMRDFGKLLAVLLNRGTCPAIGIQVLRTETVQQMFQPQTSSEAARWRQVGSTLPAIALPVDLTIKDPVGNVGLGGCVQGENRGRGRKKGSLYWYGATNLDWWVDPAAGIAVQIWGNYSPWNDEKWVEVVDALEGMVYGGLR